MISAVFSAVLTFIIVLLRTSLLHLLFAKIEPDVMSACETYLLITTLSLPFLAVYDAGAALCRSIGKTNVTMYISVAARLFFSALFGLWLDMGVIGVAIGMSIDLVFRGAIFIWREKSQKWTQFRII